MLTAAQIASMRSTMNAALPDTATVQRKQTVSDGGGGQTASWVTVATTACRFSPVGGGEGGTSTTGGRVAEETTHVVTVPANQDVTETDRLIVNARTFEVTSVRQRGAWELSRRVEVKEVP